jgi:palmitoyl-protein thioesterase
MDSSVDVFAAKVKADPNLANGFNAFGLSQGNNLIRGYIAKYNDPPVNTFMSICGINAGVGAFPDCSPQGKVIGGVCQALTEVLSSLAYNSFVQGLLFQADYFRDPSKTDSDSYKKYSQLAQWENEGSTANVTLNENFAKTEQFVWVKGNEDTVVWPREGEWFGAMDPNDPWNTVLPMNQVSRPPPPSRHRCPPTLLSASTVVIV